jgi:hypothetical protein
MIKNRRLLYMQTYMKKLLVLAVALLSIFSVGAAEKVSFTVHAPMIVSVGEAFRVQFELNAKPDSDSFVPSTFENFDVLAGPSVSQGSSVQIINGSMSKSVSYVITYVLMPQSEGTFNILPATIDVDGKSYHTQRTVVEVRGNGSQQGGSAQSGESQGGSPSQGNQSSRNIEKDDLMLRMALSSSSVYKGESIRATLKLYSRVSISGSESSKMPTFNGFWSQQIDVNQGPFRQTFNGKVYEVYNVAE